jgi:hypothetical protein
MLCKVPIESFDWKAGGHENVGWVAQHVGEILPEWIKSDRDLQRVDPDNSGLPYIIRAFQQVVERLEKLEKK